MDFDSDNARAPAENPTERGDEGRIFSFCGTGPQYQSAMVITSTSASACGEVCSLGSRLFFLSPAAPTGRNIYRTDTV
jgi:hypothetical protein